MSGERQRRLLVLCLATVYIVWGTTYIATRVGVLHLPPLLFGGSRFTISGVLLLSVAFWRGASAAELFHNWRTVLVMSLLGVALCNGLHIWAMQWVPSNTSALLNASSALWIVIFGLFGARAHRPHTRALIGIGVGFAGTALLVWSGAASGGSGASPAGTLLIPQLAILCACIIWSLGTIYMRNAGVHMDLFSLSGAQMLVGGALMIGAGVARGEVQHWTWSQPGLIAMAYLIVFSSCIAYTAYYWLARHATPAQTGTYSYVNPAIAALVGYIGLGEQLTGLQVLGALVILGGVILVNWPTGEPIEQQKPAI
jgi:drug/metabolite transporter (DMT)-like permease